MSIPSTAMPEKFNASPSWASDLETQKSKLPMLAEVNDGLPDRVVPCPGPAARHPQPGLMNLPGTANKEEGQARAWETPRRFPDPRYLRMSRGRMKILHPERCICAVIMKREKLNAKIWGNIDMATQI
ncbi:MAG: hypothetical protein Q9212_006661 [Teloschistes hypoglaucus]